MKPFDDAQIIRKYLKHILNVLIFKLYKNILEKIQFLYFTCVRSIEDIPKHILII